MRRLMYKSVRTFQCFRATPPGLDGIGRKTRTANRIAPKEMQQYHAVMSFSETIFLFVIALLIFGPKKLPEIGRQVGKILNDFKRASNEFKAQIESEIAQVDRENQRKAWEDKPKNTVMLPTAPPQGTVSADSASAPTMPNPLPQETTMAKAPDA